MAKRKHVIVFRTSHRLQGAEKRSHNIDDPVCAFVLDLLSLTVTLIVTIEIPKIVRGCDRPRDHWRGFWRLRL
jgi:hypothetical protein